MYERKYVKRNWMKQPSLICLDKSSANRYHVRRFYCSVKLRASPWTRGNGQLEPPHSGSFFCGHTGGILTNLTRSAGEVRNEVTITICPA